MWLKVSNRPCQYSQLSTSFVSIKKDTVRLVFGLLQLQTSIYDPSQCFLTGPGRLVLSESAPKEQCELCNTEHHSPT